MIDGYTWLDQYFMGLRRAEDVGPFWYVDEPRSVYTGNDLDSIRAFPAEEDIYFCGDRVELTVDDITAAGAFVGPSNGPRTPAIGDEVDDIVEGVPVDVKTMAFVLIVDQGPPHAPAHAAAIERVDTFRRTWKWYANGPATDGLGRFDTSLDPDIH